MTGVTTGTGSNTIGSTNFNVGVTTITYTATDAAGNSRQCSYTITVSDDENPSLSGCPSNIVATTDNGDCDYTFNPVDPIFSDNCSVSSVTWAMTGATSGTGSNTIGSTNFNVGVTTVTYTARDAAGNSRLCSYTITVTDDENPTISCITPEAFYNTDSNQCTYTIITNNFNPIFNDNCSGSIALNDYNGSNTLNGASFPVGSTTVVWTVTDPSGNTANCSYVITVEDHQAPILSGCPSDIFVNNASGLCSQVVTYTPPIIGSENCSGATLVQTAGLPSGSSFPVGVTTNTFEVTDASGNMASCSFVVTVLDNELPTISSLSNLTNDCSLTISTAPTSSDNCGTVTGVTGDITLPHTYDTPGTYYINWNFSDASGNSKDIIQTITVTDTNAPVPDVANLSDFNMTGCELLSSQITAPTATDACNGEITGVPDIVFPYSVAGTSTITWTYTDNEGNISTQTQDLVLTVENIDGGDVNGYLTIDGPSTSSNEVDITACSSGSNEIQMNLSGEMGTIIRWEKYEVGDAVWTPIANTTDSYTVTFDASASQSTYFRALVQVGTCYQYSTDFYVRALPPDTPPILDQDLFNICLNEEITLLARSGYTIEEDVFAGDGGDFNNGQFPDKHNDDMWRVDGSPGSAFTAGGNASKPRNWSGTNNHPLGSSPTIEYDGNDFKFAIAYGDYSSSQYKGADPTTLETPIFDLIDMDAAVLEFDQAYNLVAGDYALLELSLDGGVTYTETLQSLAGPITWDYWNHAGSDANNYNFGTDDSSFDLSAYLGMDNLRVRWTFHGTSGNSAWAIDGIGVPVEPTLDEIEWTDGIGTPGEPVLANGYIETTFTFTPEAPGVHEYGATVLVDGCRAYDENGTALAEVNVSYSSAGVEIVLTPDECGSNTVPLNAYDNFKTANQNAAKGAYTVPAGCTTCDDPGTEDIGTWSITGTSTCGTGTFSDINDPDAIFTGEVGNYELTWTVNGCASSVNVEISNCDVVDFDGSNDYVDFKKQNYDLNGIFSFEVWVKPEITSNNIQTIFSKRDANVNGNGYDLRVVNDYVSFRWNGAGVLTSPYKIGTDRWYHIAVTHSNNQYRLYIDGVLVTSKSASSAPLTNNYKSLLGAMDQDNNSPNKPVNYFNGWIDEVRIWDVALTEEQIHQMMNQEIMEESSGNNVVYGEVVPIAIHGITWANLQGYYRMDQIGCGYLEGNFGVGVDGKLKNITTAESQTAPLPYTSRVSNQTWSTDNTWTNYTVWDAPNSIGVDGTTPIDWNIVETDHDINSGNKDITVLGLVVDNGELTIMDPGTENEDNEGQMLWVTHYLKLDGSIDLVGESQLIQKPYWSAQYYESMLDEDSDGFIERDQQGIMNSFAYNYWAAPVSKIDGDNNNVPVTVNEMLRDGTNSLSPVNLSIGGATDYFYADGARSNPRKVAGSWIWKFVNDFNAYAQWEFLGGSSGTISPTEGFTMKGIEGSGTLNLNVEDQNYVFIGKPNNVPFGVAGTPLVHTTFAVPADPDYPNVSLTGNPFPSALDADQFIVDNQNSTDATLYFWEHWSNGTHEWAKYQGGYAIRKVNNGVPAVTHPHVSTGGSARSTPGDYVPVGQGFYVVSSAAGGDVEFKNSQRFFRRETENGGSSSVFIKGAKEKKNTLNDKSYYVPDEEIMRIRLGFESPDGFHRQVLAAFFEGATDGIDRLYDGKAGDFLENDAFFLQEDRYFVIQAFGEFNKQREIPISVFISESQDGGIQKFMIDDLENVPDNVDIYIKDYHNDGETYDIRNMNSFDIELEAGEHKDRFALVFQSRLSRLDEIERIEDGVTIFMNNDNKEVNIHKSAELEFKRVVLFNYIGQQIKVWDKDLEAREIKLPAERVSTGVYIVNLETEQGLISKKIIIK